MKIPQAKLSILGFALITFCAESQASDWYLNTAANITQGMYSGSQARKTLTDFGVHISGDYLERGGLSLGLNQTSIAMKSAPLTSQQSQMLSGRMQFWPDFLAGKFTTRIDLHHISNNDTTGNTSGVSVIAPQLSWLSDDASLYLDLGYADSKYKTQLNPKQYTPTLGFAFNDASDWLQLRGYLIRGLDPALASNLKSTSAVDTQWTHFLSAKSALVPTSFNLKLSSGERIFAVDMDAQSVANLSDIHKGGVSLGLTWKVARSTDLLIVLAQSRFQDVTLNNDYKLNVGYANLSTNW